MIGVCGIANNCMLGFETIKTGFYGSKLKPLRFARYLLGVAGSGVIVRRIKYPTRYAGPKNPFLFKETNNRFIYLFL